MSKKAPVKSEVTVLPKLCSSGAETLQHLHLHLSSLSNHSLLMSTDILKWSNSPSLLLKGL